MKFFTNTKERLSALALRLVRPVRVREINSSLWRWDTSPYAKSIADKIKTSDDYDAVILHVMIDRKDYAEVRRRLWPNQ